MKKLYKLLLILFVLLVAAACTEKDTKKNYSIIVNENISTEYYVGEEIDFKSFFILRDENGKVVAIEDSMIDASEVNLSAAGTYKVKINYQGTTKEVEIHISEIQPITYTINNSKQKFSELVVAKTGMESKYGFPLYEIRSLEQYSLSEYTLIAGPGTSLYFNDNPIDTAYQTEQETVASVFEQIETGPYYKTTYLMPDYLLTSSIRACDSSGNECALVWNDDHTIGTASLVPSETMQQDLTTIAENTAKAYAVFATIKYAPRDILLTYLYPDTDFSKAIRTYDNDWGITKTADSFDQVTTSDFVQYSESEYSCVVSFHYIVTQGSTKKDYPLSFTCYITNRNGKLQIVNLETNK